MDNKNNLTTKKLLKRINQSKTYEESFQDCLELMIRYGMSENFLENIKNKTICSYEEGMFIVKAFDICNVKPKMSWLPKEVKDMYR